VSKGIPVIALIHECPEDLKLRNSEIDMVLREKLERFRNKVGSNRLVKFWKNAHDLPGLVALSLNSEIRRAPGIGWVRADNVETVEILNKELGQMRRDWAAISSKTAEVIDENHKLNADNTRLKARIADVETRMWRIRQDGSDLSSES
jgi:predicted nuclease with TOPRIM domain